MRPFEIASGILVSEPISEGASGVLYRANATADLPYASRDTPLAVKLLRVPPTAKAWARFRREAAIGVTLSSPHLVRHFATGEYRTPLETRPFIVMEFIEGVSLDKAFPNSLPDLSRILRDVLRGLAVLHQSNVVHRDLQPKNVLLKPNGTAVVVDFGSVTPLPSQNLTSTWEEVGTRRYWAPECLLPDHGKWLPATDIFMLASALVALAGKRYLFSDARTYPAFFEALARYGDGDPGRPPELTALEGQVPPRTRAVLWAMLAPKPDERPSASELLSILEPTAHELAPPQPATAYPLMRALWHLDPTSAATVLSYLNSIADARIPSQRLDFAVLGGTAGIIKLGQLGLLRQSKVREGSYSEPPSYEYSATSAAAAVLDTLNRDPGVLTALASTRTLLDTQLKCQLRLRHYPGFNHAFSPAESFVIISPQDDATMTFEIALARGDVVEHWLPGIPFSPFENQDPTWISWEDAEEY